MRHDANVVGSTRAALTDSSSPDFVDLRGITKDYPGRALSFRGTKLELKGPSLWARNLSHMLRATAVDALPVKALSGINLTIKKGEVFGLLGPNGSGKTTLIKIIAGLLKPTLGDGMVAGIPLGDTRTLRQHVSYVSTTGWMGLEWALTAEENVRFYGQLCGLSAGLATTRAHEALTMVGLWDDRKKHTSALSNGMRQRVILARGLVLSTPIVLLDEPSVGLDPVTRDTVLKTVCDTLASRGQTLILADHDTDLIERLAHHVAILDQGVTWGMGTPAELLAQVSHLRVLEMVIQARFHPSTPPPSVIHRWESNERPGPQGLTHWRGLVEESSETLPEVLGWVCPNVGQVVDISFRGPTLHDVMGTAKEARRHGK